MANDNEETIEDVKSEVVDTSTNDDSDISLEDIEVTPEELEELEDKDEDEKEDTEPDQSKEDEESEEESEETGPSDEDKQKAFNREMAERRIQEKRAKDQNQTDRQQDYLSQAEDDRDLALRQLQVEAYNTKVEGNTNKLTNGYEKAMKDFDILNSTDPAIKAEVDAAIDAFQALSVTIDDFGNPSEIRGDLYSYLQNKADSISRLVGIHEANKKVSKSKEQSKIITPPSKAPKEAKVDPDLVAFDEEANKW